MVGIDIDGDTMSELKPGQELLIKKAEKNSKKPYKMRTLLERPVHSIGILKLKNLRR